MTETGPQYSERQLALLRGEVEPADNKEWSYLQDHASDVLPFDVKSRKPMFPITGDDMDRSKVFDRGNTQAGHIGEAGDSKD
jgi:hypothetical protein